MAGLFRQCGLPYEEIYGPHDFEEGASGKPINPISVADRLMILEKLGSVPFRAVYWGGKYYIDTSSDKSKGFWGNLRRSAIAYLSIDLSIPQLRVLVPIRPVRHEMKPLKSLAASYKLHHYNKLVDGEGFSARWIHEVPNRTSADPVVIYMHGGGYALKASAMQLKYVLKMADVLKKYRVSVVVLDYTVTPFKQYPGQLNEGVACFNKLAETSEKIIALGDSCGAHLSICLMQHYKYPVSGVPKLTAPFWGSILISPWVGLDPSVGGSFLTNSQRDIVNAKSLNAMRDQFIRSPEDLADPLVHPLARKDKEYWKGVIPSRTVAVWGEAEVLRDTCREWCDVVELDSSKTLEEKYGVHDCMLHTFESESTTFLMTEVESWFGSPYASENESTSSFHAEAKSRASENETSQSESDSESDSQKTVLVDAPGSKPEPLRYVAKPRGASKLVHTLRSAPRSALRDMGIAA